MAGGRGTQRGANNMAVSGVGCRKALADTERIISVRIQFLRRTVMPVLLTYFVERSQ